VLAGTLEHMSIESSASGPGEDRPSPDVGSTARRRPAAGLSVVDLIQAIDAADADDPRQVAVVRDLAVRLVTDSPGTLMDGCLDALEAARQLKGQAEAYELMALSRFVLPKSADRFRPDGAAESEPRLVVDQEQALEVAMAQQIAPFTVMRRVAVAHQVMNDYPETHAALAEGVFPMSSVRAIVSAGEHLDAMGRAAIDRRIADEARSREYTPGQTRAAVRAMVASYDPVAHGERTASDRARRRGVQVTKLPHGISRLVAIGRAEDVAATHGLLEAHAGTARAAGDRRSTMTCMSDEVFDTLLGRDAATSSTPPAPPTGDEEVRSAAPRPSGFAVELQVVVSAASLAGATADPAHLVGYGAIPVELAGQLALEHGTWFRQLVCSPDDGHLISSSRRRAFPVELSRYLRQQHGYQCAVNACSRGARDIDHVVDHAAGGMTCRSNGQPLCWWCNQRKRHPGIKVVKNDDDSTTWTFPGGRSYTQYPPPILGPGSGPAPLERLFDREAEDEPPPF
jgi:Domain of unknown function (DUF222)